MPPRPTNPQVFAPHLCQALSLKESEKTALSGKLMGTQHSLAAISLEMERQKRDAQSRQEQDRVGQTGRAGLHLSPAWRSPLSEREAWLCPGEASRLCGELQPFPGSPHLREVAQLCPGESRSLRKRLITGTALTEHQGITEGLEASGKGRVWSWLSWEQLVGGNVEGVSSTI